MPKRISPKLDVFKLFPHFIVLYNRS